MGTVVADCRSVDQKFGLLFCFGTGLYETMGRVNAALLDAPPLRMGPFFFGDGLAGEVDDAVHSIQDGIPLPQGSGRPMNPSLGSGVRIARRTAGKQRQCVTLRQKLGA